MKFPSLTQFRNGLLGVSFDIDFQELVRVGKKKGEKHLTVRDCALDKDLKIGGTGVFGVIIASGRILNLELSRFVKHRDGYQGIVERWLSLGCGGKGQTIWEVGDRGAARGRGLEGRV